MPKLVSKISENHKTLKKKECREIFILQCARIPQYNLKKEAKHKKDMAKPQRNNYEAHFMCKRK